MLEHFKDFLKLLAMTGTPSSCNYSDVTGSHDSLSRELALTGRKFDGKEALEMGFVR